MAAKGMILYNIVLGLGAFCGLPLVLPLALCSGKRRATALERLGLRGLPPTPEKSGSGRRRIWIHALSVGEVTSAVPLAMGLRNRFPDHDIFFSASTRTGFLTARRLLDGIVQALFFFPYDLPFSVSRLVRRVSPDVMVIVETDLWPNFLEQMHRRAVPVFLVNARISSRSCAGYRRLSFLTRPMFRALTKIGVPSAEDGLRWTALGVSPERIIRTGNIKFDQPIPDIPETERQRMRRALKIAPERRIVVAGSTHDGEEQVLKTAFLRLKAVYPDLCLISAPRDPDRAGRVRRIFASAGIETETLSQLENGGDKRLDGVVIDRIGLLKRLYALAEAAVVGGSLVNRGGHNPLEPAAVGVPVLFGPYMSDFREIADLLIAGGGALEIPDPMRLAEVLQALLEDRTRRADMGQAARETVLVNRGAVDRTAALITEGITA